MIGQKVVMTKQMAKWYLDNPEVFQYPGTYDMSDEFHITIQHCILSLLGDDLIGTVSRNGSSKNCYGVDFKTPFGNHWAYYEYPKDIRKV